MPRALTSRSNKDARPLFHYPGSYHYENHVGSIRHYIGSVRTPPMWR
jgi:hypothetical protein